MEIWKAAKEEVGLSGLEGEGHGFCFTTAGSLHHLVPVV